MDRPRSLFVSHGAPNLVLHNTSARQFLAGYGASIERPAAIVVASAHWETDLPTVSAAATPETVHDFGGFEPELHEMRYPARGSPEVAERVVERIRAAGLSAVADPGRGLDHGVWVPLKLLYPDADIPVVSLSVQPRLGPRHHLEVGRALAVLGDEGVLVVGSGSLTHNLRAVFANIGDRGATRPPWVEDFAGWIHLAALEGRTDDLLNYRALAPHAADNHPTEEHFLPFFVAMGAGGERPEARRLHESHEFGALQMDAYAFA